MLVKKVIALAVCALGLWAASAFGEADLKVGILSDVHLSPPERLDSQGAIDTFRRALTLFREEKVDAVVIAGDLSNDGTMTDLRVSAGVWNEVFGKDEATPVKVFVTGNHERGYFEQAKKKGEFEKPAYADGLHLDVRKNWKELFGEEWTPFFLKEVKGYTFVGAHWGEWRNEPAFRAFLSANRDKLGPAKPFFYVQHDQPLGTCFGDWYRGDGPVAAKVLADYPNAVVFSGHTHYSVSDPRAVWQGAFTSVCAASIRWLELAPGGAEDAAHRGEKYKRVIPDCWWEPQGLIMSVRGERMVFARYDLLNMEKLGDDWSVPVLHGKEEVREFAFDRRRAQSKAPQFAAGAQVTVSEREGKKGPEIVVGFPSAVGADELSRAFDYEIVGECGEGTNRMMCVKRVFQPGVQLNVKRLPPAVECPFLKSELPSAPRRFRVTPMNAFGLKGGALAIGR